MTDLLLARVALRDTLRPRRLIAALLLILLPTGIGLLLRAIAPNSSLTHPDRVYDNLMVQVVFGFTLTILSVVYGTAIVASETEQKTIVYLLTRPFPRWRILLVKFVVTYLFVAAVCILTTMLLAVVIYGFTDVRDAGIWLDIRAILIGALAYCAICLLLGVALSRPLLIGLFFVFGWERVATLLPGSFSRLSVNTYMHVLSARQMVDTGAADNSGGNGTNFLLAFTQPHAPDISTRESWIILALVAAAALATSLILFSVREYTPREGAD